MAEIFISHSSLDEAQALFVANALGEADHTVFLDTDRTNGIAPGSRWSQTLFQKLRICHAVVFLNSANSQASMWCHTELAVASDLGKPTYWLDLAEGLDPHPTLSAVQGIRFTGSLEAGTQLLVERLGLDGLADLSAARWNPLRPPYPGLNALDMEDAGMFFGRDQELSNLIRRANSRMDQPDGDLIVVVGPSGAGKSSLVRAGLAATLKDGHTGWIVVEPFKPGLRQLDHLVSRLAGIDGQSRTEPEIREVLATDGLASLADWLVDHHPLGKRMLIVVDQLEELTNTPAVDRDQFLQIMSDGLGAGSPLSIVVTVRSDRLLEAQELPLIGPRINETLVVAPMNRDQLAAVIEQPARRASIDISPTLVSRLINDAVGSQEAADALPLLSFTLREMYDIVKAERRTEITEQDYERVGRISGAIASRVETVEESLSPSNRSILIELLPRFVALSDDRSPVGRPLARHELSPSEQTVVDVLEDARLLTGTGDTVRLVHEQLIEEWPTLAHAVTERRDDLLLRARLERQAKEWQEHVGGLLGRDSEGVARQWLERQEGHAAVEKPIKDYVRSSHIAIRRRQRRTLAAIGLILLLLVVSVGFLAYNFHRNGQLRAENVSNNLASESANLMSTNFPLASQLGVEAMSLSPTEAARNAVISALQEPLRAIVPLGNTVDSVAFDPNGQTLAVGDDDGAIKLVDPATGTKVGSVPHHGGVSVNALAFTGDGNTLIAGDGNGNIDIWSDQGGSWTPTQQPLTIDGSSIDSLAVSGQTFAAGDDDGDVAIFGRTATAWTQIGTTLDGGDGSSIDSLAFSPDGQMLVAGDDDGDITMFNAATHASGFYEFIDGSSIDTLAFSPSGQMFVAGDFDGDVDAYSSTSGAVVHQFNGNGFDSANSIVFSATGDEIWVGTYDGVVSAISTQTWDVAGKPLPGDGSPIDAMSGSPDGVLAAGTSDGHLLVFANTANQARVLASVGSAARSVVVSRGGQSLFVGDDDGTIWRIDVATGQRFGPVKGDGSGIITMALSPDGDTLIAGTEKGDVLRFDAGTLRPLPQIGAVGSPVYTVAFSPDGTTLVVGTEKGKLLRFDATNLHPLSPFRGDGSSVTSAAFSPDGKTLVAGTYDGNVLRFDTSDVEARLTPFRRGGPDVTCLTFSKDGTVLAAGDEAGNVTLWNPKVPGASVELPGDGSSLYSVSMVSDSTLASATYNGTITIWDIGTKAPLAQISGDGSTVYSLASGLHDGAVVSGDQDGSVTLVPQLYWDSQVQALTTAICSEVRANMSKPVWSAYVPQEPFRDVCPT